MNWGNKEQKTTFNDVMQEAYSALMSMDLQSKVQDYTAALEQLRHYVFVKDTKATREEFECMILTYKRVVELRAKHWREKDQKPDLKLLSSNKGFWGSRQQWAYGEVISRLLFHFRVTQSGSDLHPVFAILLNPLGGIAGPSNMSLLTGDMHTSVSVHAIVHDAFGYVHWAHNVGPGYNYLAINSVFANHDPLSCQCHGILQARRVLKHMGLLGDMGRNKRELEMVVACRKALSSQDCEIDYPKGSVPSEKDIKADYASRRNISLFNSCGQFLNQLMLNVHMKMWKKK